VSTAERPLRILAVGDARSIHTLRYARRLVDRGHEVHVVSNRTGADPRETEGVTVHDLLRLDPLMRVPRLRRLRFGPAIRRDGHLAGDEHQIAGHDIGDVIGEIGRASCRERV